MSHNDSLNEIDHRTPWSLYENIVHSEDALMSITKRPLSSDDGDIWPNMEKSPVERRGATDMILCLTSAIHQKVKPDLRNWAALWEGSSILRSTTWNTMQRPSLYVVATSPCRYIVSPWPWREDPYNLLELIIDSHPHIHRIEASRQNTDIPSTTSSNVFDVAPDFPHDIPLGKYIKLSVP